MEQVGENDWLFLHADVVLKCWRVWMAHGASSFPQIIQTLKWIRIVVNRWGLFVCREQCRVMLFWIELSLCRQKSIFNPFAILTLIISWNLHSISHRTPWLPKADRSTQGMSSRRRIWCEIKSSQRMLNSCKDTSKDNNTMRLYMQWFYFGTLE